MIALSKSWRRYFKTGQSVDIDEICIYFKIRLDKIKNDVIYYFFNAIVNIIYFFRHRCKCYNPHNPNKLAFEIIMLE